MVDSSRSDSGDERLPLTIEHSVKLLKAVERPGTFATSGAALANFGNFYRPDVWLVQLLRVLTLNLLAKQNVLGVVVVAQY